MKKRYLIISDTHLGYKAKDLRESKYIQETQKMDKHFKNFLDFYTNNDDYTYELIINGDFIDFIAINYRISVEESDNYKLTLDEIKYGLSSKEKHIVWKLRKIAKIHFSFFQELSNFISNGNSITIIKGNHDVEFYWPKVQEEFKTILIDLANPTNRDNYYSKIKFKDWFYYKNGLFYIEHGNQYEEFTSFNNFLVPLNPINIKKLETPYTHISIRYWINLVKGVDTENLADWGYKELFLWIKTQGIIGLFMQFIYYFRALFISLSYTKIIYFVNPFIKLKVKDKIRKIALDNDLDYYILSDINKLKHKPIGNSIFNVLRAFYFEWFLIVNGFFIFLIFSFISKDLLLISKVFIIYVLTSIISYFIFSFRRETAPDKKLSRAAVDIADILNAKYIIFGHTHHPLVEKINDKKVYLNTGSWLSKNIKKYERRFHFHLSHIVIDEETKQCSLRNWSIQKEKPVTLQNKNILDRIDNY